MDTNYSPKQLEIMDIALSLFAKQGYDNTSVRDIANEAGINLAMISYYFGSKEKLLEAIFIDKIKCIRQKLEDIVRNTDKNPLEKMYQIIDTYIDLIVNNKDFHSLMVRDLLITKSEKLYKTIIGLKQKNVDLIKGAIKAGEKAGYFRKGTDINMMSLMLFGAVNQTIINRKYVCEQYKISVDDDTAFNKVVISKLRTHLKTMFTNFLTNDESFKK